MTSRADRLPDSLIVGTGEYVTGFVHESGSKSDKGCGVVGLVHFDLRRRGKLGSRVLMAGTNGTKFPAIRRHLKSLVDDKYRDLSSDFVSFPSDEIGRNPTAYEAALQQLKPGDVVSVFTPDDTHLEISLAAINKGCHVMVAKPIVMKLEDHVTLQAAAREKGVLVMTEVHKRFDPVYSDARQRMNTELGDFGYFYSYMSQPKFQLETFRAWAGISSDISFYLNSHHIDLHVWSMQGLARPVSVRASAASGQASRILDRSCCEDTITLMVQWVNMKSGNPATAVYTASWTDSVGDVHSQQHFYYQGHNGFLKADQAHRGYFVSTDSAGFKSVNPLYMKYTTDTEGYYSGQSGYGYQSFERFVHAATQVNSGLKKAEDFDALLPTVNSTLQVTAILHAGRLSLDSNGAAVQISYDGDSTTPKQLIVLS